jgi:inosose dehydratase
MTNLMFGCQSYAWQMSGAKYLGRLDHIIQTACRAGFSGIETEVQFLVGKFRDPRFLKDVLAENSMELSAITLVEDWLNSQETETERDNAEFCLEFLASFPETMLVLCQMPRKDRGQLQERQQNLLRCANAVALRASARGIRCTYHPNSPAGSVFRTSDDYEILLNGLNSKVLGYTPDVGHIANGGMDPMAIIQQYRGIINHIHFKDRSESGFWAAMGKGVIDFPAIVSYLLATGFVGWCVVEDECKAAEVDPDEITRQDGIYTLEKLHSLNKYF